MKAEISTWVWILGLTIMGIFIFSVAMSISTGHLKDTQRKLAIQEYSDFYSKTTIVCKGGTGNIYPLKVGFPENIKAIYSSDIDGPPPDKVSVMITDEKKSFGRFFCIQFYNEEPLCEKLDCDINMTYMGTPSMKEDLFSRVNQILKKRIPHSYAVSIEKVKKDSVVITAKSVIVLKENLEN